MEGSSKLNAELQKDKMLIVVGLARQLQASAAAANLKYQEHVAPQVAQLKRMHHVYVSTPVTELPEDAIAVFGDKCVSCCASFCRLSSLMLQLPRRRAPGVRQLSRRPTPRGLEAAGEQLRVLGEEHGPVPDAGPARSQGPRLPAVVDFRRADVRHGPLH